MIIMIIISIIHRHQHHHHQYHQHTKPPTLKSSKWGEGTEEGDVMQKLGKKKKQPPMEHIQKKRSQ